MRFESLNHVGVPEYHTPVCLDHTLVWLCHHTFAQQRLYHLCKPFQLSYISQQTRLRQYKHWCCIFRGLICLPWQEKQRTRVAGCDLDSNRDSIPGAPKHAPEATFAKQRPELDVFKRLLACCNQLWLPSATRGAAKPGTGTTDFSQSLTVCLLQYAQPMTRVEWLYNFVV